MFKATLTAAALILSTLGAHANTLDRAEALGIPAPTQATELSYYCEWATAYDYWGNWVTVWQCY